MTRARLSFSLVLVLAVVIGVRANLGARQGRGQGATPAPDVIPTSASSIVKYPAEYLGHMVTITVSVARSLGANAFTVDQNHNPAFGEVLVIAPKLFKAPAPNDYVTVIGNALAFDPAEVASRLKGSAVDLSPTIVEEFRGKPAIIATSIVSSAMTDLTKAPPPPMSADDEALSALMKQISPASSALRTAAGASDAATVKTRAEQLKQLFTDAQVVFKNRTVMTALIWSGDAIKQVDAAAAAAAAGKWEDATAAVTSLNQTCSACHAAHRERQDDGSYRLKTGG